MDSKPAVLDQVTGHDLGVARGRTALTQQRRGESRGIGRLQGGDASVCKTTGITRPPRVDLALELQMT
jgi:hypothetical protein